MRQGVTTEIIGHCGFSVAPALPGKVELLKDYLSPSAPWLPFRETSFPDYLQTFPPTAVNAGMLVGHNTLRLMVMGMAERAPSATELAQMIALLEDALDAGALGLSSGLFTPPGSYAEPAEMIALGHVLKRHNAGYFTHLRDESEQSDRGGRRSDRGRRAMRRACRDRALQMLRHGQLGQGRPRAGHDRRRQGARRRRRLRFLSLCGGLEPAEEHLAAMGAGRRRRGHDRAAWQNETRQKIRADIARDGLNNWGRIPSWDCVQISISPHLPQFSGRTIASLAAERGADPVDTLCDYLADDQGATRVLVTSISEADIRTIVASPLALVGSDGNCVAPYGTVGKGMPHPRFYGTFPRVLSRYVRDENALPLALAIHKMTGATARALKLKDRGLLREGFCADVVLFDPDDFTDRATYADPHQFPSGARTTVIVNGTLVVENATHTGALPGTVLRARCRRRSRLTRAGSQRRSASQWPEH